MIKLNIQRFSSTNKTANYELSQYVDTDKPSYLGDYNSDMLKIDTAIHENATNISASDAKAETAKTTADTALSNANDADSKATTAQSTATSALEKSTANEANINKFNLTDGQDINYDSMTAENCTITSGIIHIAKDNSESVMKIYGQIRGVCTANQSKITIPCNLTVENQYTIFPGGVQVFVSSDNAQTFVNGQDIIIKNNSIELTLFGLNGYNYSVFLMPCIYFNKDFGDSNVSR